MNLPLTVPAIALITTLAHLNISRNFGVQDRNEGQHKDAGGQAAHCAVTMVSNTATRSKRSPQLNLVNPEKDNFYV